MQVLHEMRSLILEKKEGSKNSRKDFAAVGRRLIYDPITHRMRFMCKGS